MPVRSFDTPQYRAFGQKLDPSDGSVIEEGFYALSFREEPMTVETAKGLQDGIQLVCRTKSDRQLAEWFVTGDASKPFDDSIFSDYDVVRMVLDFDALNAKPVELTGDQIPASASASHKSSQGSAAPKPTATPSPTSVPKPTLVPMDENKEYQAALAQLDAEFDELYAPHFDGLKQAQAKLDSGEYTQEQYDEEYRKWDRAVRSLDFDYMMAHAALAEKYGYHITIS